MTPPQPEQDSPVKKFEKFYNHVGEKFAEALKSQPEQHQFQRKLIINECVRCGQEQEYPIHGTQPPQQQDWKVELQDIIRGMDLLLSDEDMFVLRSFVEKQLTQARNEGIILGWKNAKSHQSFSEVFGGKVPEAAKVRVLLAAHEANVEQRITVARADERKRLMQVAEKNWTKSGERNLTDLDELRAAALDSLADQFEKENV